MTRRLHGYQLLLDWDTDELNYLFYETARAEFIALRGEVEVVKPVSEW
ncbi:hypothetical protein [Catellatospora paridis]|nr:hypothetical protein [Catellatospora paridis]